MREYSSEPVPDELLTIILRSINQTPSAGNLQAFEVFVVNDQEHREALVKAAYDQEFIGQAPVVLIFCTNRGHPNAHGD